ncbi:MAG: ABC transporter substrate-binding protein [Candidatus Thermoplasmatota archaeon]|nr:ABC transporter substrate-binding protein [Candidatus Thermoplasmatota archaeon]
MKKTLLLMMTLTSILAVSILSGCIETGSNIVDDKKIEPKIWNFTDPMGELVVLDGEPDRIVTLTPALTEMVYAVGAWDKMVGCDSSSDMPPEAKDLEHVVSWQGIDAEKLVVLDPDLVIMDRTLDITDTIYAEIKELDIPVYRIYPRNLSDVLDAVEAVGELTNETENATAVIEDFEERMEVVSQTADEIAESDVPAVLHVTYYDGTGDPWVATDSTFSGSLITIAGGECAISESSGYGVQMSLESIIESNPDIIFCSQSSSWPTNTREAILGDDRWSEIGAVSSGSVFDVEGDWCDRTGPRLILGLEEFHGHIMDHVEA